jgi:CubicO group peptidase (beta-lactamase class C family)
LSPGPALDRQAHWQAVVEDYQAARRLPSLVAGVLLGGELVWVGTAGAATGADVQHRIGSITKAMTAVLLLQCRDEGLLGLEDELGRYVPESGYAAATLRQLLSHTSGLRSEPSGPWWERSEGRSFDELVVADDGSGGVLAPGEAYHYSNLGFALLGEVVARSRSASWTDVVADRLWEPLGMRRTTSLPRAPAATGFSVDHLRGTLTTEPAYDTGGMAPAGQVWSTLGDLARFARFLRSGEPGVLHRATLDEMATVQPPATDYGLGLLSVPGANLWGHLGSMPGFQSCLFVDRESGRGLVALCNGTTGFSGTELVSRVLGPVTPVPPGPWVPTAAVPPWADELLGWWFWGNSAYEVRFENGLLELRDLARGGTVAERFDRRTGHDGTERIVGVAGYHLAETLHVRRTDAGAVHHLECATFVYTRTPYDPTAPVPGRQPRDTSPPS